MKQHGDEQHWCFWTTELGLQRAFKHCRMGVNVMSYLRKLWHGDDYRLAEGYTHIVATQSFLKDSLPFCLLHFHRKWH